MNDKSFPSSKAPASKSENAWPGSVKFHKNCEHNFSKNSNPESDSSGSSRHSAVREAKFAEFENETIQKQRQEMQLLIAELRSRDRELNEMVAGHRKQLMAWEQDRTRIAALEEKCSRYERELHGRNEEIYGLTGKLRVIESEEESRQMALRNMQDQLNSVTEQHCQTSQRLNEAQEVNRGLGRTIKELKSTVGQHEQREQELFQLLSSKDRDLSEAASHIAEISAKLKRCEFQQQESVQANADLKRQVSEWRNKHAEVSRELDHAKKQNAKLEEFSAKQRSEVQQLRQQLITCRSEVTMSNEREQRKEELLQLQKSKQDRTDAELAALRELCEIQQRDLSLLQSSLDTAKNLLNCRQKSFNQDRSNGVNYSHSQMLLLTSQSVTPSFSDSPIRSYLMKSGSPAGWKDTDAADSNFNNHANLMLSRYSALRVSESSKVTSRASNTNFSAAPFNLERKTYDWQGRRSVEDVPEKQLTTVELDESPTKDVMSSDLEKIPAVKEADRIQKVNVVESRVESGGGSGNRPGPSSSSLVQSRAISPWEGGLSASTRTLNVLSSHVSWLNQKPQFSTSSEKSFPGHVEESDDDVVRDEVSMGDHTSADEGNVEGNGIEVVEESKVEEGKLVGQDRWKRDGFLENGGSRLKTNSAVPVITELRGEKLLGMSSVVAEQPTSKEGCVENGGGMSVNEGNSVRGGSIVGSKDSTKSYTTRLSSAKDDDDSKQADICPSELSFTKVECGFQPGSMCPSKLSSSKDNDNSQSRNYRPSQLASTRDEVDFKSGNYSPSKFSSSKENNDSQLGNHFPSKFHSSKDDGISKTDNCCPSKFSSSKEDGSSKAEICCLSKLSPTKDEGGSQLGNYKFHSSKDDGISKSDNCCPSKFSITKDNDSSQLRNYCPSELYSTKESGFQSGNYCQSKLSSSKDDVGCLSGNYSPLKLSSPKDNGGSQPDNYSSSRLYSTKDDGGSRADNRCPSRLSSAEDDCSSQPDNYCRSRLSSTKDDDSFQSDNYCLSRSSTKNDEGSQADNYCRSRLSSTKDDEGSQPDSYCRSRLSSSYDCRSRSVSPGLPATVKDQTNVGPQSKSSDDSDSQLITGGFSPSKLPSPQSGNDLLLKCCGSSPELGISWPLKVSIVTGDNDPELEKTCPSRVSTVSSVSQYSFKSLPTNYGRIGKAGEVKFPVPSNRSGGWSGSYEKLSEAVGKDWARSCSWKNSTTGGDPMDNSALRRMSSLINGVGRVGSQRDVKVDLKVKSEAGTSDGKDTFDGKGTSDGKEVLRQDNSHRNIGKETFLREQDDIIEILVQGRYGAQSSGTISESSSHLDVFSDALA